KNHLTYAYRNDGLLSQRRSGKTVACVARAELKLPRTYSVAVASCARLAIVVT
ncbi:MAG: hypothetical protein JWM21_4502, partial [Acidobacteria bacterium]|nr:hypothetical protein [Acidobacteriota bacterium]